MHSPIKSTLLPSPKPILLPISSKFLISFPTCANVSIRGFSTSRPQTTKCISENKEESSTNLKDALSGIVDERVEELLNKEENKDLLDGLEKASLRVEMAKSQLAQIKKQELEAKRFSDYINQLEKRASEIAECQREILEARGKIEESERSLNNGDVSTNGEEEGIEIYEERVESIKAAFVSALVGTLAGLPVSLTQVTSTSQLLLPLAITFISCTLFGVTFRYTIRRDLDNFQLKTGTSAAFGFVKGLAMLGGGGGTPIELNTESLLSHAFDGAVYVSENLYVFFSAAVALDFCFKMRLLSPFPIKQN